MQKLALYLSGRLEDLAQVGVVSQPEEGAITDSKKAVWIGSKCFIDTLKKQGPADHMIVLTEEEPGEEHDTESGEIHIYRYQSCEKLYQQIMQHIQRMQYLPAGGISGKKQKWIVMTADVTCASLLAFSVTYAQLAGEQSRVLYLNLSECSGMEDLFFLERGMDLSDYIMALRSEFRPMTDAYTGRLEQIDYILPASNPMVLHELNEEDVKTLIQTIQTDDRYDCVVAALGTTCRGCEHIIARADRLIHLTGSGLLQEYSRKAWIQFTELCGGNRPTRVEQAVCPKFPNSERGIHLLYEWMEGAPGTLARKLMRKGEQNRHERRLAEDTDPADE